MAWTYSGDPSKTDKDAVRFLTGDTKKEDQLVLDEEIEWVLSIQPEKNLAAAAVADMIAARFSREADKKIGSLRVQASQRADQYRQLADRLRAGGAGCLPFGDSTGSTLSEVFVGGNDVAEKENIRSDTNTEQPSFLRRQDDHPGTRSVDRIRSDLTGLP